MFSSAGQYFQLCKPRVVTLIVFTAVVGIILAAPGWPPLNAMLFGTIGIGLAASSAAAINHLLDQRIDAVMARTRNRPLPTGQLSTTQVLIFALTLALISMTVLVVWALQGGISPVTMSRIASTIGRADPSEHMRQYASYLPAVETINSRLDALSQQDDETTTGVSRLQIQLAGLRDSVDQRVDSLRETDDAAAKEIERTKYMVASGNAHFESQLNGLQKTIDDLRTTMDRNKEDIQLTVGRLRYDVETIQVEMEVQEQSALAREEAKATRP